VCLPQHKTLLCIHRKHHAFTNKNQKPKPQPFTPTESMCLDNSTAPRIGYHRQLLHSRVRLTKHSQTSLPLLRCDIYPTLSR
jgi:hypothetical protein